MLEKIGNENGNQIYETSQAKLRNQLGPFWTLMGILDAERLTKLLSTPAGQEMINACVENCKKNQPIIINIITETEQK